MGGLRRFPDVRETNERVFRVPMKDVYYTPRTVRTYVKHPPVSACRSATTCITTKRGNITT
jgi:hypothetical protein